MRIVEARRSGDPADLRSLLMSRLSTLAAAVVFSTVGAQSTYASSVTVATNWSSGLDLFDGFAGQSGSLSHPFTTPIGQFWGTGVVKPAAFGVDGVAFNPDPAGGHDYMAVNGDENLVLNAPVNSFSFLWGSVDDYNNVETIQGFASVFVPGQAVLQLLPDWRFNDRSSAWVTIASDVAFDHLEFRSLGPAIELQFAGAIVTPAPEASTLFMVAAGLLSLWYVKGRKEKREPVEASIDYHYYHA